VFVVCGVGLFGIDRSEVSSSRSSLDGFAFVQQHEKINANAKVLAPLFPIDSFVGGTE